MMTWLKIKLGIAEADVDEWCCGCLAVLTQQTRSPWSAQFALGTRTREEKVSYEVKEEGR